LFFARLAHVARLEWGRLTHLVSLKHDAEDSSDDESSHAVSSSEMREKLRNKLKFF
jgi:hypothetical protein